MSTIRIIIFSAAIVAYSHASGIDHLVPAVKSYPVVRYAPFYNFPGLVRSIHAVAPAVAPTPVLPAPLPARIIPAPLFPTPAIVPVPAPIAPIPAPFIPATAPIAPAPASFLPAPSPIVPAPAPFFPAPVPFIPGPLPGPITRGSLALGSNFATAVAPAYSPTFAPATYAVAPHSYFNPVLPKLTPAVPAFPSPLFARPVATLTAVPFAPTVRHASSVLSGVAPAPLLGSASTPIIVTKPYEISPYTHLTPNIKETAWK